MAREISGDPINGENSTPKSIGTVSDIQVMASAVGDELSYRLLDATSGWHSLIREVRLKVAPGREPGDAHNRHWPVRPN